MQQSTLSSKVEIQMIPDGKDKFEKAGEGTLTLTKDSFILSGAPDTAEPELTVPTACFAALPYKPGVYIEIQHGETIYRCLPEDGRLVIKFINMVKIFHELTPVPDKKR